MLVQKKHGKTVKAYQLGMQTDAEQQLTAQGKIILHTDGSYELFSQESEQHGERAQAGDFFKVDSTGFPYPNAKDWFIQNHIPTECPNVYEQMPKPLKAWQYGQPECEEILWLRQTGRLMTNENDEQRYFSAKLWGTMEYTPKDSIIVFYQVTRNEQQNIIDIDFNFVAKMEFEKTYDRID